MASPLPIPSALPESWQIRLPAFEGPLDLLLHLIKINEVEITDLPVAPICDQFHAYLEVMERLDLDIAGEYIYMAAYLVHLKSKMLLPRPRTLAGQEVDEDPREDLVARLLEYRRLKEAAQSFAEVYSVRSGLWTRDTDELERIADTEEEQVDFGDLSLFDLLQVLKKVLDRFEREHPEPMRMAGETYSVRDQIERLLDRIGGERPIEFFDDLRALSCRREAIAAFLAVLEMVKLELVRLHQTAQGLLLYRTGREIDRQVLEAIGA